MLYNFLLSLLILDGLILAGVVLLQAGQGGGLASMGGGTTDLVMGGRQAVTILHKTSWISGGVFMFLALLLAIVASNGAVAESAVQQRLRQQPSQQTVPAAPLQTSPAPATATPPPAPVPPPATRP
jgi:protein translocase SecG subunit